MRTLLDECVPKALERSLRPDHQVLTVAEAGWGGLKDDVLLRRASEQFDAVVSVDASIRRQQHLQKCPIIFVLLEANRNDIPQLKPLVPQVLQALTTAQAGQLIVVTSEAGKPL